MNFIGVHPLPSLFFKKILILLSFCTAFNIKQLNIQGIKVDFLMHKEVQSIFFRKI